MKTNDDMTWNQVKGIIPYAIYLSAIIGSWYTLSNQINLIGLKVDGIAKNTDGNIQDIRANATEINGLKVRVAVLETKKASSIPTVKSITQAVLPSPVPQPAPTPQPLTPNSYPSVTVSQSVEQKPEEKKEEKPQEPQAIPLITQVLEKVGKLL